MTNEQWQPVPNLEGLYEVSDQGRVRSLTRTLTDRRGATRTFPGRVLKAYTNSDGYPAVNLPRGQRPKPVHHLVLAAFVGPIPDGMERRHLNGVKADARLINLAYGTKSENNFDRVAHGTDHNKRKTHCPQGHEYAGDNLILLRGGYRRCRTCKNQSRRRRSTAAA